MRSPAFLLTSFVVVILAATVAVFFATLARPHADVSVSPSALSFATIDDGGVRRDVMALLAPSAAPVEEGQSAASLAARLAAHPAEGLMLEKDDFVEDPDMLTSYQAINRFYARQAKMRDLVSAGTLRLAVAHNPGDATVVEKTVPVADGRHPATLPLSFWLQIGSGLVVILIAAFFLALRPRNFAVSAFAFAGLGIMGSAYAAAIYSSRQFGMSPTSFVLLSEINHLFTVSFGFGMIALFSCYPVRLFNPARLLVPVVALTLVAITSYRLQLLPHDVVMLQNVIAALLVIILVMIGWQFWATRGRPADRAALFWLGLSVLSGTAAFVLLVTLPVMFGYEGVVTQALGFVMLCMIYIGIAFAVSRYRLFDIGRWSYRVLLYAGIVLAILALDLLFVLGLQMSGETSLAAASVIALVGYLPVRDWIYDRLFTRSNQNLADLHRKTFAVAYNVDPAAKQAAWIDVLTGAFRPAHVETGSRPSSQDAIAIRNEGIELSVPAYPWSAPLTLGLAGGGRRLFDTGDVALTSELADLVRAAETDRLSYERGAAEERQRIARDLHDDVGARLLSGLHAKDETYRQEAIVDALADIRQISRNLAGNDLTMERFIGQLRHESRERAASAGVATLWPLGNADQSTMILPYQFHRSVTAMLREALSNALAHGTGQITISTEIDATTFRLVVGNPLEREPVTAAGPPEPESSARGQGLRNMAARARQLGGTATPVRETGQFVLRILLPLPGLGVSA
jgi:signal transduction histidine kinase